MNIKANDVCRIAKNSSEKCVFEIDMHISISVSFLFAVFEINILCTLFLPGSWYAFEGEIICVSRYNDNCFVQPMV